MFIKAMPSKNMANHFKEWNVAGLKGRVCRQKGGDGKKDQNLRGTDECNVQISVSLCSSATSESFEHY